MTRRSALAAFILPVGFAATSSGLASEAPARLVTMSGRGEVRAAPVRATVMLGVLVRAPTVEPARAEADRIVAALLTVAHELADADADADLHATRLSGSGKYDFGDSKRLRQLVVELNDIDPLGELIEKGFGAGASVDLVRAITQDGAKGPPARSPVQRFATATMVAPQAFQPGEFACPTTVTASFDLVPAAAPR